MALTLFVSCKVEHKPNNLFGFKPEPIKTFDFYGDGYQ